MTRGYEDYIAVYVSCTLITRVPQHYAKLSSLASNLRCTTSLRIRSDSGKQKDKEA
jgi:hypothetical protein